MIFYKTDRLKETEKYPTELDMKRILSRRSLSNSRQLEFEVNRLEAGVKGEEKVVEFLEKYGRKHWLAIRNMWLSYKNNFEIDLLLLTKSCIYLFEIKHYTGKFTYENGLCTSNDSPIETDPIHQARRNVIKVNKLFQSLNRPVKIKGVLVFMSELNQVQIKSPVEDLTILQLTDLYEYIKEIVREENNCPQQGVSPEELISHLTQFEIMHPYLPQPLTQEEIRTLKTGIHCARCKSWNLKTTRDYLICECGLHESREEAIIRTACDYGVLQYDRNFKISEILHFINHQASRTFVRNTLAKHFQKTEKNRYTDYETLRLPYHKVYSNFQVKRPLKLYADRGNMNVYLHDESSAMESS